MFSALGEIIVPLAIAFLLGWFVMGWLTWRWRHTKVTAAEWDSMTTRAANAETELRKLQQDRGVVDNRLRRSTIDLERSEALMSALTAEHDQSRAEVARLTTLETNQRRRIEALEIELGQAAEQEIDLRTDLTMAIGRAAALEGELDAVSSARASIEIDLTDARATRSELESRVAMLTSSGSELRDELDTALGRVSVFQDELAAAQARVAELEDDLRSATEQIGSLENDKRASTVCVVDLEADLDVANGRIGELEGDLEAVRERTAELERELAAAAGRATALRAGLDGDRRQGEVISSLEDEPGVARGAADPATSRRQGVSAPGTRGAFHTDDLQVIYGIGPKLAALLGSIGITSWEQVAAFTEDDIEVVSAALKTFPDRIRRDRWVQQAGELVSRFPDRANRPTREAFLNRSADAEPWT